MLVTQSGSGNKSHRLDFLGDFRSCPHPKTVQDNTLQTSHTIYLYRSSNAQISSDVFRASCNNTLCYFLRTFTVSDGESDLSGRNVTLNVVLWNVVTQSRRPRADIGLLLGVPVYVADGSDLWTVIHDQVWVQWCERYTVYAFLSI
jgi:hypothetical protein